LASSSKPKIDAWRYPSVESFRSARNASAIGSDVCLVVLNSICASGKALKK
jgi:hypothetical protein